MIVFQDLSETVIFTDRNQGVSFRDLTGIVVFDVVNPGFNIPYSIPHNIP